MTWFDLFNWFGFFTAGYAAKSSLVAIKRKIRFAGKYKEFMAQTPEENFHYIKRLMNENRSLREQLKVRDNGREG